MMKPFAFSFWLLLLSSVSVLYAQDESTGYEETTTTGAEETEGTELLPVSPVVVSEKKGYTIEPMEAKRFDNQKWKQIVGDHNYLEEKKGSKKKKNSSGDSDDSNDSQSSKDKKRFKGNSFEEEDEAEENASMSPINSPIVTVIFYAAAIAIIAALLFLILKNVSLKSNAKVSKSNSLEDTTALEDIKELEIDRLLREALATGNYRLVIRLYFLEVLQKLDHDGIIIWKKDKTNRDYLSELFIKEYYYSEVRSLTLAYEKVWYGDYNLSDQAYSRVIDSFKELIERLKTSTPA